MSRYLLVDFLVLFAFGLATLWVRRSRKRAAMPPGPRSHGLWLDNSREVLKSGKPRWMVFGKWKDEYGLIFTIRLGTKVGVVISSAQIAWDLLEKRGDIYSSRPRNIVAGEILSRGFRGLFAPYGDKWRKFRKILNIGLSGKQALTCRAFQTLESAVLLQQILDTPASFLHHVERFAVSTVFSISYGRRIKSIEDPIVKEHSEVINGHLHEVRDKMANGTAKECMSSRVLSANMPEGYSEEGLAFAASSPYVAGVDTTLATLHVFLLATVCNPEVMKKAQAELDTVVGRERLPTFQGENILPYCGALIKEVTRQVSLWRPVAPLGVAHATTRDDYHNGYILHSSGNNDLAEHLLNG
ncbi:hypothetical protein EWM64_g847 [Hericium alpestre]|uniref:Cytochrome P450 n=1 Tax=Hericium alpestre TaxID=135208 RepID=A0A4Z0A7U2_9AGAM|nr:hypothetical protein EWM64_g847 [Hericium alpestre]